jgi:hypothetical protein
VTVPQGVWKLLEVLEHMKKAFLADKECNWYHGSTKAGDSSTRNGLFQQVYTQEAMRRCKTLPSMQEARCRS